MQRNVKVAFDTNMLLAIQQFKVDVFSEVEKMLGKGALLSVPMQVFEEVLALGKKGKGRAAKAAQIALQEIGNHKVQIAQIDAAGADEALAAMAKAGHIIATNDAVLRKRIKGFAAQVIYLRQKRFLEIS